ncbi:TPM domain-containing protein [Pseudoduganella sp. S-14]|uniref:TPM domain-containing protein n=1 Tax=Pseudoduganella sp. S-14 TaxID=3404065 RepID=UPI003CEE4389
MATTPRHTRGGGKASSRDEDRLSDPLIDRDLARRTGGLAEHARRWTILPGSPWLRVVIGLAIMALLALVVTGAQAADGFVAVPAHAARVTDQAGMLTAQQRSSLDGVLADYERKTGSQIAILLVSSTAPEAIEQYSIRVAEAWKLGRKGVDDGVLLVVAKDNPPSLRRLRIEAGRGVQGTLTDAQSKRVLQDVIAPHFRQGDFYGGLAAGVSSIATLLDKEHFPAPAGGQRTASGSAPGATVGGTQQGSAAGGAATGNAGVAGMAAAAGAGGIPGGGSGLARGAADTGGGDARSPVGPDDGTGHAGRRGADNGDSGRGARDGGGWSAGWLLPLLLFGVFVILPMMRGGSRRGLRRGGWGSDATGVLIGAALGNALSAAASRSGGGSWGGSGDFGGGFSGGGGSFDGGGASGDW